MPSLLNKYHDSNPAEYEGYLKDKNTQRTKLKNPKGSAKAVKNVLNRFQNDPEKGKESLGGIIHVNDAGILDQLWEKLAVSDNIEATLAELEFKIQPGKEADTIARQLMGEELQKMQGEFSAKYEFNQGLQNIFLRFEVSKRRAHGVVGLNMGVCVAPDKKLWNDPNFMNVIIWDQNGIAQGGMHILLIEDDGKKYLSLPGINPSTSLLTRVNADDIYNKLIAYALELSQALGYDGVRIPTKTGIHSNRTEIQRVISVRRYKTLTLSKEHDFSYSPHAYSFNTVYVVDKAQATVSNEGGINLTSSKFLQVKNFGVGIKFHLDPAMLSKFQNAPGFVPVIINIQPLKDIPAFLGLDASRH